MTDFDAVVVGAGPNGLAAAIELAANDLDVLLLEANDTVGGSARTEGATLPGFRHDIGSAIHPLGAGSPYFASLPLAGHGLEWVHSPAPLAHPLVDGSCAVLERDLTVTAAALGPDAAAYQRIVRPFVDDWPAFARDLLGSPFSVPHAPLLMARFAPSALRPASATIRRFQGDAARALFAGNAAHAGTPLSAPLGGAVGLTLMVAGHAVGWPFPRGGAGQLTAALASYFTSLGGTIQTGVRVASLNELPAARAVLLGLTFGQVARIGGERLPTRYRKRLAAWRYGTGAFKLDWALDGPIPWTSPEAARAATVHVGGTFEEIARSEQTASDGGVSDHPFVLLAQPSLFDATRAPAGKHTAWAYCHVPNGWTGDATQQIEAQIERFAPGFRDLILARARFTPADLETWNPNLVGGDVNGGAFTFGQTLGADRWGLGWRTPRDNLYVCSASTPPGGGVHGMAGYHAARAALRHTFGVTPRS